MKLLEKAANSKLSATEKTYSIFADIIAFIFVVISWILGGFTGLKIGFFFILGIFFFFAIPFEREWIKKGSWMHKFLTQLPCDRSGTETWNLCSLPGRIFCGLGNLIEKILCFIGIITLNFFGFFFLRKVDIHASIPSELFVDYNGKEHSRSILTWPIWVLLGFAIMFGAPSAITYYSSNVSNIMNIALALKNFLEALFIFSLFCVVLYGLFFPFRDIVKSILNILKAIFLKMCLIRKIPEAA